MIIIIIIWIIIIIIIIIIIWFRQIWKKKSLFLYHPLADFTNGCSKSAKGRKLHNFFLSP